MTHGDADHINGIQELLQNQKQGVEIDALVLPPEEYMDEKLLHLAEMAKENGTRVLTIYSGEEVGTYLKCIAPLTTRKMSVHVAGWRRYLVWKQEMKHLLYLN